MEKGEKCLPSTDKALSPARSYSDVRPPSHDRLKGQYSDLDASRPPDSSRVVTQHDLAMASSMVLDPTHCSPSDQVTDAQMHPHCLTAMKAATASAWYSKTFHFFLLSSPISKQRAIMDLPVLTARLWVCLPWMALATHHNMSKLAKEGQPALHAALYGGYKEKKRDHSASQVQLRALRKCYLTSKLARASLKRLTGIA
eukprot:95504-Pelagomonas_calceolata.AAC.1